MDAGIVERRRRRRISERRRAIRRRRRNALAGIAAVALGTGAAVGAGSGGGDAAFSETAAGSAVLLDAGTDALEVPTVSDFHDPVPILMYHAISPPPAGAALPGLFVPEAEFEGEMTWLADNGYHGVTLDEVFAAWDEGAPIAENPVVISFDDGLLSQYEGARPILTLLGWPAVLNLEVDHVDEGELPANDVRELIDLGWEVDSHTFTHPDLRGLDAHSLRHEIAGSRRHLQSEFGIPVNFFAYPAGQYDDAALAAVEAAGYVGASTVEPGLASPEEPFALKRIRVEPGDGADGLAAKLGT